MFLEQTDQSAHLLLESSCHSTSPAVCDSFYKSKYFYGDIKSAFCNELFTFFYSSGVKRDNNTHHLVLNLHVVLVHFIAMQLNAWYRMLY